MKKKLIAILLAAIMVLSLAACSSGDNDSQTDDDGTSQTGENDGPQGDENTDAKTFAVFNYNSTNAAANPIFEGMIEVIEENGDNWLYFSADNTEANILQVFDEIVARDDIDAIVWPNINDTLLLDSIERADEKGITCATMDIRLEDDETTRRVISQTLDDNYQGGYDCADAILTEIESRGETPQVIYMTYRGNNACRDRSDGYDDAMAEHPDAVLLYEGDITTMTDIASTTEDLLQRYPECNAIFCVADSTCVSVLAGCKAQDREDILLCTQDGGTDVQSYILNGDVYVAACQPLYEMGKNVVESVYKEWNGGEDTYWYNYEIPLIFQDNVQETIDQFESFEYKFLK